MEFSQIYILLDLGTNRCLLDWVYAYYPKDCTLTLCFFMMLSSVAIAEKLQSTEFLQTTYSNRPWHKKMLIQQSIMC